MSRWRALGDDHPDTLMSVSNLASAYVSAGDLGRAISLFEQALTGCRRVLGDDHPQMRIVAGNREAALRLAQN
ncbi:tetratricopeptide repeat protein [Dactylosporangium sp. NPDC000244]|uniref:tetratricopeptide repeat protein n=1 Tax=Dactylosporangium sp. NPDC000244 TaxID=3154365 RepID=UPI003316E13C